MNAKRSPSWVASREAEPRIRDRRPPTVGLVPWNKTVLLGRTVLLRVTGRDVGLTPEEADALAAELVKYARVARAAAAAPSTPPAPEVDVHEVGG